MMDCLPGFTPWPDDVAARYRAAGYWRGETLGGMLRRAADAHPGRLAVVCGERRWSYAQLDERCDRLAAGFARLGIGARDRVVVQLPNVAEFYVVLFALFRLGAIPVLALPAHRRAEIGYFVEFAEARAYVIADTDGGFDYRTLARVLTRDVGVEQVIVAGDPAEFTALDSLYDPARRFREPAASEVAFLQLSGGSTGLPKMIPRTHDDYLYSVRASAAICGLDAASVYLCVLPAAHNFPLSSPGALGVFHAGGRVVLARHGDPDHVFGLIQAEGVTITAVVPPLALVWVEAAKAGRYDLASLQLLQVGGAKLSPQAAARIKPALGCRLQQVFGMAEGLVNYTRADDPDDLVLSTQGRPISPDDEMRVVDDDDRQVEPGETGHLQTRGPYTIRGYYLAPEHNARAFTVDGFYRTGDLVAQLPSGHLIVEGRAKDQINRGGEKVAAEEVENHLLAHPAVADCALVAMPDAFLGERSCAFIVVRDSQPAARELKGYLSARGLAQFKIPDRFEFIDSFPKTAVGKVDKRRLRARFTPTP